MRHGSKLDETIWELYEDRGDEFLSEGIELLTSTLDAAGSRKPVEYAVISLPEGKERLAEATVRTNQKYFRNSLLDNYQRRCCLTGLAVFAALPSFTDSRDLGAEAAYADAAGTSRFAGTTRSVRPRLSSTFCTVENCGLPSSWNAL